MTQKQNIRFLLIIALFTVSLGGLLLHMRIHPPSEITRNLIPFFAGIISIIVLPVMFLFKKSMTYAYVINGIIVIIGTITMVHFSILNPPVPITFQAILFQTLFADVVILFTKFFLGKSLFELEMFKTIDASVRHGRIWRYPNMGWWGVHFLAMSLVYVLGNIV